MAINHDLDMISGQTDDLFTAMERLQALTVLLYGVNATLQDIKDNGQFDSLPVSIKQMLGAWWGIFKDAEAAIDADARLVLAKDWVKPAP